MIEIPNITVPIITNGEAENKNLFKLLLNKKVIIFGVPGAFTPTCSEQHLPSFLKLRDQIFAKGIDDIFCLAVNDKYVMQSWLLSYSDGEKIKGIADGNAEVTKYLGLLSDKSSSFMGMRCLRFSMIINNNNIEQSFIEDSENEKITYAENILSKL